MTLCKKGKEEKHNNYSPQTISNALQTKYLNSEAGIQKFSIFHPSDWDAAWLKPWKTDRIYESKKYLNMYNRAYFW